MVKDIGEEKKRESIAGGQEVEDAEEDAIYARRRHNITQMLDGYGCRGCNTARCAALETIRGFGPAIERESKCHSNEPGRRKRAMFSTAICLVVRATGRNTYCYSF